MLGYFLIRSWSRGTFGFLELILLAMLSGVCVLPVARWLQRGMPHLPLGEGFAFMHLVYYVIPCLGVKEGLTDYSTGLRLKVLLTLLVYMGTFVAVYWRVSERVGRSRDTARILRREVDIRLVWVLFAAWVVLMVLGLYGMIPFITYATRNIFNSLMGALGSISVVCLFYRCGRGAYGPFPLMLSVAGLAVGAAALAINGTLIISACVVGAAVLAYSLGRKKIPIIACALIVSVVGFLQAGKADYREALGSDKSGYVDAPTTLGEAYRLWFRVSWRAVAEPKSQGEAPSLLARTSLIHILLLAEQTVPAHAPYLYGKTYAMLPELLIPRIFWPDKMRGTYPTEYLGIYLGIQTEGGSDFTGIAVGSPTEGWVNFGWIGMALAGAFFGWFYGLPAGLTRRLSPQNIGWLMCCVFLVHCVDMEHSLPETLCSVGQSMLMSFLMLLVISGKPRARRKAAPAGLAATPGIAPADG